MPSLIQKWGAVHWVKLLWDVKSEIGSLHLNDFTINSLCKHHVSILVSIIHYYNLLE